jgi:rhomboid protease GluP
MCPNCRAFITTKDRVCPYCGIQLGPRVIDVRAAQLASSFVPQANLTSIIFLIINAAFFIAEVIANFRLTGASPATGVSSQVLLLFGAKYAPAVYSGQWWRLITAGFLHAGFFHVAMNSWALWILVTEVEQFYGTSRLIAAYIFSTFTGFLLSLIWSRALSLGASAACYGLIGIMLAMGLRRSDPLAQAVRAYYRQWVIFGLVLSLLPGVDIAAHIGGLAGGFLVGLVGGLPGLPNSPREILWKTLAALAIAITLFAFWEDYMSYHVLLRQVLSNT